MAKAEDSFKVCGLCSELVDESVEVSPGLRVFLIGFLGVSNTELPTKVCLECYTHTVECKRFKDRCDKSIVKLQRSEIYSAMILGRSEKDMASLKDMKLPAAPKPSTSAKALERSVAEEAPPTPLKSGKPGPASKKNKPGPASKKGNPDPRHRNNELQKLLDSSAVLTEAESRKSRAGPVQEVRSRRSEAPAPIEPTPALGPRGRRSLPVEPPEPVKTRGGPKQAAGPASKKAGPASKKAEPTLEIQTPTRATRGGAAPATTPKSDAKPKPGRPASTSRSKVTEPRVVIRRVERQRADREFERHGVQRSKEVITPAKDIKSGKKRGAPKQPEPVEYEPPKKRGRPSLPVPEPVTPKQSEVSSFGRKRTPKSDKSFISTDDAIAGDDDDDVPIRKSKPGPANKATPKKATPSKAAPSKATPSKASATKASAVKAKATESPKSAKAPQQRGRKSVTREEIVFVDPPAPTDDDDDDEEMFPSIGPYQCEICQNITNTKQEFVDHIKANHRDVVDEEVLDSLEKDLEKSRRKAEKEQKAKKAVMSPAAKKSPSAKKTPGPQKKAAPTPKQKSAAASPSKAAGSPARGRKRASMEESEYFVVRSDGAHCKVCDALLPKTAPSEVSRHRQSKQCKATVDSSKTVDADVDPLADIDASANGVGDIVDDIVSRTCQYCGKVVDDIKDLPGHYSTKGCMAKKYQIQNGPEPSVVMENAEDDDTEQIVPNNIDKRGGGDAWDIIAGSGYSNGENSGVVVENVDQLDGFSALVD